MPSLPNASMDLALLTLARSYIKETLLLYRGDAARRSALLRGLDDLIARLEDNGERGDAAGKNGQAAAFRPRSLEVSLHHLP